MHVRLPRDMYLPSPLGRFRVPGVVARWAASPPARTSRELWFAGYPFPRSKDLIGTELRAARVDLGVLSGSQPSPTLWEPEMGANVFSLPRT